MPNLYEYFPNGGAESAHGGLDDFSVVPISVERIAVYPLDQGVANGMPTDDGRQRNRVDLEHDVYNNRVYALTLMQSGPAYAGIIQHVMWENAERFSVRTGQQPGIYVDSGTQLPYIDPSNTRDSVWLGPEIYEPL